jgi:hypothetical protein
MELKKSLAAGQFSGRLFPGTVWGRWLGSGLTVSAVTREPTKGRDQLGRQLHAAGVDGKASFENLAAATYHIQITAGGLRVEDIPPLILQLFKTAATALFAEGVPLRVIHGLVFHGCQP